ncbi:hypothetical protein Gotur_029123 [Gossypium turneri]
MESSLPKGAIEIADVDLLRREDEYFVVKANCISSIMELALNCSAELPEERKDMKDVVVELKKIKQSGFPSFFGSPILFFGGLVPDPYPRDARFQKETEKVQFWTSGLHTRWLYGRDSPEA